MHAPTRLLAALVCLASLACAGADAARPTLLAEADAIAPHLLGTWRTSTAICAAHVPAGEHVPDVPEHTMTLVDDPAAVADLIDPVSDGLDVRVAGGTRGLPKSPVFFFGRVTTGRMAGHAALLMLSDARSPDGTVEAWGDSDEALVRLELARDGRPDVLFLAMDGFDGPQVAYERAP
ncbi:MAG: hypothetical protein H6825_09055 [Planctomycetes bacterium]|nr:hypothetical protein [Planctomycetota bacterium]